MNVNFKFGIGDIVDWLNPHDTKKEVKRGKINSLVYRTSMFRPTPHKIYYVSFIWDENIICEEDDLVLYTSPSH